MWAGIKIMKKISTGTHVALLLVVWLFLGSIQAARGETRTLEFPFALSADLLSEFSTRFTVLSSGRMVVEVTSLIAPAKPRGTGLTVILLRPDESEAIRKQGPLPFRSEYLVNEQELDQFVTRKKTAWAVKLLNGGEENREEVRGVLRIVVPATPRVLIDTQFTLLGSGNAQEIPFLVPAAGKIQIDAEWEIVPAMGNDPTPVPLTVSLIHPGISKVHARRQNRSPQRIEHQVTAGELDAGARWIVRFQNDSQSKVRGKFQVTFAPAL